MNLIPFLARLTTFAFAVFVACSAAKASDSHVSNEVLLHEKNGRLVDATSAAGVAGATVLAWKQ